MNKTIPASAFQAKCLRIINEMAEDGEPVTITNRGRPVAVLSPVRPEQAEQSIVGAMQGSVLAYDDPFQPAADSTQWNAVG